MKIILFVILLLIGLELFMPKFKVGDTVYNKQFNQLKKITKIDLFNYRYCIYKNGKCSGDYYTRINWFNNNHKLMR